MPFSKRIWITRKSRIEASERLNRNDLISKVLINYYSVFIVSLSIYDLYESNSNLSLYIVIGSLLILCTSIFISARNFKERSLNLKNCYIRLDRLCREVERLETNPKKVGNSALKKLEDNYDELLELSENHSIFDYLSFKQKEKTDDPDLGMTMLDYVYLYSYRILKILFTSALFAIPLMLLYYSLTA